jgi:hypothetical protein
MREHAPSEISPKRGQSGEITAERLLNSNRDNGLSAAFSNSVAQSLAAFTNSVISPPAELALRQPLKSKAQLEHFLK